MPSFPKYRGKNLGNIVSYLSPITLLLSSGKDIYIGVLPIFHLFGMFISTLRGPYMGTSSTLLPRFEPQIFLDAVKKYQVLEPLNVHRSVCIGELPNLGCPTRHIGKVG